jgi:hypothetical protein
MQAMQIISLSGSVLQQRGFAALCGGQQGGSVGDRKQSQMSGPVPHADGIGSQEMFVIPPASTT